MRETHRLLLVLLAPVFVLVLLLVTATAQMIADARRTEVAALRSRGMPPWRIVLHYMPESVLLAAAGFLFGQALAVPVANLMGLFAGFLQLVDRPLPPAELTAAAVWWGAMTALAAEAIAALPIIRLTRLTVVTFRQEEAVRPVAVRVAATFAEVLLVAATLYAAWSVWEALAATTGPIATGRPDFVHLLLPALLPFTAGILLPRVQLAGAKLVERLAGDRIGPRAICSSACSAVRPPGRAPSPSCWP